MGASQEDAEAVLEANEAFYRAFAQRDLEAMDGLWAREAPVACIHPGWNILEGRDQVMASWRGILSNPSQPRVVSGGARLYWVSEDAAYVTCREFVGGGALAATNVFVREGGAWRLVHHHSSPVAMREG